MIQKSAHSESEIDIVSECGSPGKNISNLLSNLFNLLRLFLRVLQLLNRQVSDPYSSQENCLWNSSPEISKPPPNETWTSLFHISDKFPPYYLFGNRSYLRICRELKIWITLVQFAGSIPKTDQIIFLVVLTMFRNWKLVFFTSRLSVFRNKLYFKFITRNILKIRYNSKWLWN